VGKVLHDLKVYASPITRLGIKNKSRSSFFIQSAFQKVIFLNKFSDDISDIILISFPTIVNSNTDYEKQYAFPNNIWYS